MNLVVPHAGKYYSHEWIRKNILKQSDDDIEMNDKQIAQEGVNPQFSQPSPEEQSMGGGSGGGGALGNQEQPAVKPQTSFSQ